MATTIDILELELQLKGLSATINQLKKTEVATEKTQSNFSKLKGFLSGMQKNWFAVTAAASGLFMVFRTGINVIKDLNKAATDEAVLFAQQEAVLRSTGNAAGMTSKQLVEMANSIQQNTIFSDDAVRSAQNMGLTFTNIKSNTFPEFIKTVTDVTAAYKGVNATEKDLQNTSLQIGKALNDPAAGLTMLTRIGITFSDEQKKQIKLLMSQNDLYGAQKIMLGELQKEFGGSAEAISQTTGGLQKQAANLKVDIKAALGEIIQTITRGVSSYIVPLLQKTLLWIQTHRDTIIKVIRSVMAVGKFLIKFIIAQPKQAIASIGAGIKTGTDLFNALKTNVKLIFDDIIKLVNSFGDIFKKLLSGDFKGAAEATGNYIANIGTMFQDGFNANGEIAKIMKESAKTNAGIFVDAFIDPARDLGTELGTIIGGGVEESYYAAGEIAGGKPPNSDGTGGTGFVGGFAESLREAMLIIPEIISKPFKEIEMSGLVKDEFDGIIPEIDSSFTILGETITDLGQTIQDKFLNPLLEGLWD
jgi:hypothetical protein